MTPKRPILLVLSTPPPYGGGEIRAGIVAKHFKNDPRFRIFSYARPAGSKSTQGRMTVRNVLFGFVYIGKCCWLMLRCRPAVIFFSLPKAFSVLARMIPVIFVARLLKVKVCGELAGAGFNFIQNGGWQKSVGLFILRRMHSIRFLGEHIREAHAQYRLPNPVVFANGIRTPDDRTNNSVLDNGALKLLAVGALNRSKGTGRVIEAVALCRENGLDVSCTLVGEWSDSQLESEMRQFIAQHQLEAHIHFTGLIKGEQKWEHYRQAAILVHPTDWDGQPLTILEAIGMGLAVISTPVGAIPDTVLDGKNGTLLSENTPEKLYETIRLFYMDRKRLRQIMEYNQTDFNCRFAVEKYLQNLHRWLEAMRNNE
jgi:glycosyltransferase involved in cell wall biosynthesis